MVLQLVFWLLWILALAHTDSYIGLSDATHLFHEGPTGKKKGACYRLTLWNGSLTQCAFVAVYAHLFQMIFWLLNIHVDVLECPSARKQSRRRKLDPSRCRLRGKAVYRTQPNPFNDDLLFTVYLSHLSCSSNNSKSLARSISPSIRSLKPAVKPLSATTTPLRGRHPTLTQNPNKNNA